MEVDFDNLRKRLISDYNSLTRKLNDNVKDKSWNPEIIINPEEIRSEMKGLMLGIVTLSQCYMENKFQPLPDIDMEDFFENNLDNSI